MNADNIPALEASVHVQAGGRVKTLQLSNVYEKIADAYNNRKERSVYNDELYLVKK